MGDRGLITGGAGFIGSCLARELIREGQEVHFMLRPQTNHWRLVDLKGQFKTHTLDLLDREAVLKGVTASRPDVIYHLATHGHRPEHSDRSTVLAANLMATAHLLDAFQTIGCRRMVH